MKRNPLHNSTDGASSKNNITPSDENVNSFQLTNQLGSLLSELTAQEKAFADMLQEEINKDREIENEAYRQRMGLDLPNVEN